MVRGRNAKGTKPRLGAKLCTVALTVREAGGAIRGARVDNVVSALEAMMILTKTSAGPVAFGRPGVTL